MQLTESLNFLINIMGLMRLERNKFLHKWFVEKHVI